MTLDEEKKQKVIGWIKEGRKLSEIQNLLASEFGIRMTYMEVRLLIDDLKVMPVDNEIKNDKKADSSKEKPQDKATKEKKEDEVEEPPEFSDVSVTIDEVTRPGAVMSGRVKFSDGVVAEWYFDEMGRLGLVTSQPGYRPSERDVKKFQVALQKQLNRLGYF